MKNSDMPAMPSAIKVQDSDGSMRYLGDGFCQSAGLTKREYFAGLAMQAYLSGVLADGKSFSPSDEEVAQESVAYADALLKELEKDE